MQTTSDMLADQQPLLPLLHQGSSRPDFLHYYTHVKCSVTANSPVVQATSDMLAEQQALLPLLHQLEAVSSGSTIGPLSETLLEELQQSGSSGVGQGISQLRAATRAAMRAKAMARRKAMLASLNMPAPVNPLCCVLPPPPPPRHS